MVRYAADLQAITAAQTRLRGIAHRTPVLESTTLNQMARSQLFFKCENLQRAGAFKFRGAFNAVSQLESSPRVVVTHSSGNHAQALALAAKLKGFEAHIVMPENAPAAKRQAVLAYGGQIYSCAPSFDARLAAAEQVQHNTGGTLIPPFDDSRVIAGQGTIALELLEQIADLDAVVVPIGGGGLISGIALALREAAPTVRVIGAEPALADDAARGKACGTYKPLEGSNTAADGLRTSLGELTWPVVRDIVSEIITVSEDDLLAATRLVWERMKLLIEPSAGVAVHAALSAKFAPTERVAVILCGGNVDLDALPWAR